MSLRSLELVVRMEGQEVARVFNLDSDSWASSTENLAELLGDSVIRGLQDKPDILKGMLLTLFEKIDKARK